MSQPTILHVEDDDASAFLLLAALQQARLPNPIFRVSSGEDALAFLFKLGAYERAETPSLILLDLNLPRMDGFRILSILKSRPELRMIPVAIMSSSAVEADRERVLALGATRFLDKSSDLATVSAELQDLLSGLVRLSQAVVSYDRVLDGIIPPGSQEVPCP